MELRCLCRPLFLAPTNSGHGDPSVDSVTRSAFARSTRIDKGVFRRVLMLSRAMRLSSHAVATFRRHVSVVVGFATEKEMRGIYTGRVIASVKDALAFGYLAVRQYPRDAMRTVRLAWRDVELAVAESRLARSPNPATIWPRALVNFRPKTFSPRDGFHSRNLTLFPLGMLLKGAVNYD